MIQRLLESTSSTMRLLSILISTLPTFVAVVRATDQLERDTPFPEITPLVSNDLYEILAPGTVRPQRQTGSSKDRVKEWSGRLDYKRDANCVDPTYVLVCPANALPCCPAGYTVCCPDPSDSCCQPGYFCVGTLGCCLNGTTACGTEHCCPSGTTCCNGESCCQTGYVCSGGQCINPSISIQSTQSVQSVASVASASSQAAITLSSISLQSISSELAAQTNDGSDQNSIATVNVFPNDHRIKYEPDDAWGDTNESGIGSCSNGTKITTRPNANFTFIFKGTDISLFVIPSSSGGTISVQIDGDPASTLSTQSNANGGCLPSQIFVKDGLTDAAHELTVRNGGIAGSNAGTLEFNSIVYTGKGAFGTAASPSSKKNNSAVIGGSVGGVIGALVLVGAGVAFWLHRRNQQRNGDNATAATPATPNQPIMYQGQPAGGGTSPLTPRSQPVYSPGQDPVSPAMSQTHMSAYGGYFPGPQPSVSSIQPQPLPPGAAATAGGWGGYQDTSRPVSGASPPSNVAPLPMWVERARGSPARDDDTSMMTGSDQAGMSPTTQNAQAGALYGSYHPSNAPAWGGR